MDLGKLKRSEFPSEEEASGADHSFSPASKEMSGQPR
jgi:hypothetical protein